MLPAMDEGNTAAAGVQDISQMSFEQALAALDHVLEDAGLASDAEGRRWAQQLHLASDGLRAWVRGLVRHDDREYAYRAAGDFLQALAMVLLGHAWARAARLA